MLKKNLNIKNIFLLVFAFAFNFTSFARVNVVTTLPDYESIAKTIAGNNIVVKSIVTGNQDAHFIRPKPSFVNMIRKADLLISTGLDLELWLPSVVNKSGNPNVRSGQIGYVAASSGVNLMEKPTTMSRAEGGVHIYGNPHMTCSPINMKIVATNITSGLIKNDPVHEIYYRQNLTDYLHKMDTSLFGEKLTEILGGETLSDLASKGTLISFLKSKKYKDKKLIDYLDGWIKKMLPLRGTEIVTYHKNWIYFLKLFGLIEAGTVEPKPGISPSPKHVTNLVSLMKNKNIKIIMAANYFDEQKINTVADKVDAYAVIVPLYVNKQMNINNYFELMDYWVDSLLDAATTKGII